jgi:hypothetical protein
VLVGGVARGRSAGRAGLAGVHQAGQPPPQAHYATPGIFYDKTKEKGQPFAYHVFGTALDEATVDLLRGTAGVDAVRVVHDNGRSINPLIDRGQAEGAIVQGIGWVTLEELAYSAEGRLLTDTLSTYKVPDIRKAARGRGRVLANADNPAAVLGSKAIGEPPFMYGIGAFFAIRAALRAFRLDRELPPRNRSPPERILRFLHGPVESRRHRSRRRRVRSWPMRDVWSLALESVKHGQPAVAMSWWSTRPARCRQDRRCWSPPAWLAGTIGGGVAEREMVDIAQAETVKPGIHTYTHAGPGAAFTAPAWADLRRASLPPRPGGAEAITSTLAAGGCGVLRLSPAGVSFTSGLKVPTSFVRREESWLFAETIGTLETLTIVGGGHVALALSRVAAALPLRIVVLDDAPTSTMLENQWAHETRVISYDDVVSTSLMASSPTSSLTHEHANDEAVLGARHPLLPLPRHDGQPGQGPAALLQPWSRRPPAESLEQVHSRSASPSTATPRGDRHLRCRRSSRRGTARGELAQRMTVALLGSHLGWTPRVTIAVRLVMLAALLAATCPASLAAAHSLATRIRTFSPDGRTCLDCEGPDVNALTQPLIAVRASFDANQWIRDHASPTDDYFLPCSTAVITLPRPARVQTIRPHPGRVPSLRYRHPDRAQDCALQLGHPAQPELWSDRLRHEAILAHRGDLLALHD